MSAIILLPKRVTRYPDSAIAHSCPSGRANNIPPRVGFVEIQVGFYVGDSARPAREDYPLVEKQPAERDAVDGRGIA